MVDWFVVYLAGRVTGWMIDQLTGNLACLLAQGLAECDAGWLVGFMAIWSTSHQTSQTTIQVTSKPVSKSLWVSASKPVSVTSDITFIYWIWSHGCSFQQWCTWPTNNILASLWVLTSLLVSISARNWYWDPKVEINQNSILSKSTSQQATNPSSKSTSQSESHLVSKLFILM